MERIIEILLYQLKPGTGAELYSIMQETSVPLHLEHGIDVVWHGRSLHDPDGYGLIRAFSDLAALETQQSAFYAGDAWRAGPRESIIRRIATSTRIVIPMADDAIEAIRRQGFFLGPDG